MTTTFTTFLVQIDQALAVQNGPNLAYLLRTSSPHGKDLVKETRNPTEQSLARFKGKIEAPWDEIAIRYVLVVNHVVKQRPGDAFREQDKMVLAFFRYFVNNSGWTLPALFCILRDLRDLAFDADFYAKQSGERSEYMENAARTIQKALSHCMTDRASPYDQSRKWGIYYVVGLILKCYFRVKRISLSKNIFRALEGNTDRPPLSAYPRSHQVTYHFYTGMIAFLNEEYEKSENELTLAFDGCLIEARNNQERTLAYLIPLRLLRGHLPSTELLRRFPQLDELFSPFIAAIRRGDLRAFDSALERWERKLSELNLFFTLERSRELCVRGLFRRAWVTLDKTTRMPIGALHAALTLSGMEVEEEEAECLVANMIYKGYMKGYISHEQQMVVLSAKNAFPRVADRPSPYAFLS